MTGAGIIGHVLVLGLLCVGCGPTQSSLKARKAAIQKQKTANRAARQAAKAGSAYAHMLKKKNGQFLAVSKTHIERLMNAYLPYPFQGKHINRKRLTGQFKFHRARNITLQADNSLRFTLSFSARNVRANLKGVTGATKAHAQKIREAMEGGGHFDVEVYGHIDAKGKNLVIQGDCTSVTLKKHNTKRHRDMLKDGINKKFMSIPLRIPLPEVLRDKKTRLVSTPHHVVLVKN